MIENFEHYITRNISAFYKRRIAAPVCYLLILLVLWFLFPIGEMVAPSRLSETDTLTSAYDADKEYVTVTLHDLSFTGYTMSRFGSISGYWYYGEQNDNFFIALLTPLTCEQGLPTIESATVRCRIVEDNATYQNLLTALATDLNWTENGLKNQLSPYYYSEPDYNPVANTLLFFVYFGTMIYALISLIRYILYTKIPAFAPACQNLVVFGNPKAQLEEAEEELATLPQLATEDMFITEHYFILTSPYANAIVPIDQILWIYKHSTLNKFLWYHFSISYTLRITANKHMYIQCPKNLKSNIDGIIDYLSEANHNILVGFTEENRRKVQENQEKPFHVEKLTALLNKQV